MTQRKGVGREVAMTTALLIVLLCCSLLPSLQVFAIWLLPIPVLVFTVLSYRSLAIAAATVTAVVLLVAGLNLFALLFGLAIYFIGFAMGESLRDGDSQFKPIITGTIVFIMLELVRFAVAKWSHYDIYAELRQVFEVMQKNSTISPKQWMEYATAFIERVRLLTPSIICITAVALATINLLIGRAILGNNIPKYKLLLHYRLPESTAVFYVIALTCVLFGWGSANAFWWQVFNNVSFLAGFFIGIQGIAYIWRNVQHLRGKIILLIVMVLASTVKIVTSIYVLLGLLELMNRTRRAK